VGLPATTTITSNAMTVMMEIRIAIQACGTSRSDGLMAMPSSVRRGSATKP
jgi:hypothetical protein